MSSDGGPGIDRASWLEGMIEKKGTEVGRLRRAQEKVNHSILAAAGDTQENQEVQKGFLRILKL